MIKDVKDVITAWITARKEIKLKELEFNEQKIQRKREENTWALVHRKVETWTYHNRQGSNPSAVEIDVAFDLYENILGDRKIEIQTTKFDVNLKELKRKSKHYMLVVKPWLKGQYVKDINTYEQAQQGILIDKLKG